MWSGNRNADAHRAASICRHCKQLNVHQQITSQMQTDSKDNDALYVDSVGPTESESCVNEKCNDVQPACIITDTQLMSCLTW